MQWATTFRANHSLDGPMDARGSEIQLLLRNHAKNLSYFPLLSKDQKRKMCLGF